MTKLTPEEVRADMHEFIRKYETREEIIAKWNGLTAQERDAWVAEAVMSWRNIFVYDLADENGDALVHGTTPEDYSQRVPKYTTDISAAWTVFDTFPYATIETNTESVDARVWDDDGRESSAVECTAPEAIGLAALLAKLTEVSANG